MMRPDTMHPSDNYGGLNMAIALPSANLYRMMVADKDSENLGGEILILKSLLSNGSIQQLHKQATLLSYS
ncbi:MAG: hypothetical protein EA367_13120 [Leptolyngbya sp. DLM2.Bin15]|nr:MAG: hypothetical protein EA367_13120 [Leptolyngbya sp. DLM2.Bin15]